MKTYLKYSILVLFILFSISCKKDLSINDQIIGNWEWINTVSLWTGIEENPQTEGYSLTIEFLDNGIMKEYKNNDLQNTLTYTIEPSNSMPGYYILNNSFNSSPFQIIRDTLIFNAAYVDGPVTKYHRK